MQPWRVETLESTFQSGIFGLIEVYGGSSVDLGLRHGVSLAGDVVYPEGPANATLALNEAQKVIGSSSDKRKAGSCALLGLLGSYP